MESASCETYDNTKKVSDYIGLVLGEIRKKEHVLGGTDLCALHYLSPLQNSSL